MHLGIMETLRPVSGKVFLAELPHPLRIDRRGSMLSYVEETMLAVAYASTGV